MRRRKHGLISPIFCRAVAALFMALLPLSSSDQEDMKQLDGTTCIMPMEEGQSLADSPIWNELLVSLVTPLHPEIRKAKERDWRPEVEVAADDRLRPLVDSQPERIKQGSKGVTGPVSKQAAAGHSEAGKAKPHEVLLKIAEQEATRECVALHSSGFNALELARTIIRSRLRSHPLQKVRPIAQARSMTDHTFAGVKVTSDQAADAGHRYPHVQGSLARVHTRRLEGVKALDEAADIPTRNRLKPCWDQCEGQAGNCSSGFCGGGVCCKRWHFHTDCPVGIHTGCSHKHCCVDRPANPFADQDITCHAKEGSFCLWSIAWKYRKALNQAEICALKTSIISCPLGFFCRGGTDAPRACPRGSRCPGGSSEPLACPVGHFCPVSIWQMRCPATISCVENTSQPIACPAGHYCPRGKQLLCPAGHFCAAGSRNPTRCSNLARCPEGSSAQGWDQLSFSSLSIVLVLWTLALKAVPQWFEQKGAAAWLPVAVALGALACTWLARFELIYHLASLLAPDHKPAQSVRVKALLGGVPHQTALVFLTAICAVLYYGHRVSFPNRDKSWQPRADAAVCMGCLGGLMLYFRDLNFGLLLIALAAPFVVLWALLTQQGTWEQRVGLLAASVFLSVIALCCYGAYVIAKMYIVVLLVAAMKEGAQIGLPRLLRLAQVSLQKRINRAKASEKERGALLSLARISVDEGVLDGEVTTAAAVGYAAAACLDAQRSSGNPEASASDMGSSASSGIAAWAPWVAHYRQTGGRHLGDDDLDEGGSSCARGVSFDLQDVSYRLETGRRLLHDLTFAVPAGCTVAIMGASGSGKTTLLSVLSGRCGDSPLEGDLRLNGTSLLPTQMAEIRPLIGYVPQDDVLHTALTVRENIMFQAELRLPLAPQPQRACATEDEEGEGLEEEDERVDAVVNGLGLGHVSHRVIHDGLSGGQRKRASIGMEIVAKPQVLLLDEPSSGLDSATAHTILEMVLRCAKEQSCTTFSTIHQPRWATLSLFDMLVLLCPGGYLCYAGPVAAAKDYFNGVLHLNFPENENPVDVIIDACTFESARKLALEGGLWNPPQCLRAVLFPTPQSAHLEEEEQQAPWQHEEFGRVLAALWSDFSVAFLPKLRYTAPEGSAGEDEGMSAGTISDGRSTLTVASQSPLEEVRQLTLKTRDPQSGLDFNCRLAVAARERASALHWAQQVWVHFMRTLLLMSRSFWSTIALNAILLMLSMVCLALALPPVNGDEVKHLFLPSTLMFLLLSLSQSIAAQKVFGGEERNTVWREAGVCSLPQVALSFLGKDLASLTEIVLYSLVLTFVYWPLSHTFATCWDVFSVGFAALYSIWGLNHIWAISLPGQTAMLLAVVSSFLAFLFAGLKPEAGKLLELGEFGKILLLVSPVRWSLSHWVYRHTRGPGSTYFYGAVKEAVKGTWRSRGFDQGGVEEVTGVIARRVIERWMDRRAWTSHIGQLLFQGLIFRGLAMLGLVLGSSLKASGGQLPLGLSHSRFRSNLVHSFIYISIVFNVLLQLLMLGHSY